MRKKSIHSRLVEEDLRVHCRQFSTQCIYTILCNFLLRFCNFLFIVISTTLRHDASDLLDVINVQPGSVDVATAFNVHIHTYSISLFVPGARQALLAAWRTASGRSLGVRYCK